MVSEDPTVSMPSLGGSGLDTGAPSPDYPGNGPRQRLDRGQDLADGFGDTDYVAREIIKAPDVVDYTVKESITDRVARKFGAAVGNGAVHAMAGIGRLNLR